MTTYVSSSAGRQESFRYPAAKDRVVSLAAEWPSGRSVARRIPGHGIRALLVQSQKYDNCSPAAAERGLATEHNSEVLRLNRMQ